MTDRKTAMNRFKQALRERQQIELLSALGSPTLAELFAGCGFDWILIDTEHSPNELPDVIAQLRAQEAAGVSPVVRPTWSDMVLVKRVLDAGAQSLLFPYVQSAEEAAQAVSYSRYPPHGLRGISSASRAARYGLDTGYLTGAADDLCMLVQIENAAGLADLERIAAVEGVDGVFIGSSDLTASLGHAQHPDVQAAIDDAFRRLRAVGEPAGYLTTHEAETERRVRQGVDFVAGAITGQQILVCGGASL
jgi:4-hydroxy-2-oxoheptanedioate aldolase